MRRWNKQISTKKNSRSTLVTRLKLKAQSLPGWKKECKVLYALCLESKDEFLGLNSLNAAKKQEEEHLSVSELQDSRMKNRTNRLPNHQGIGMVNLIRWETVLPGPPAAWEAPKTNPKNPSQFWVLAKSQDPKGEKSEHQVAQDTTGIQNQKNHAPHQNNHQLNDTWSDDWSWLVGWSTMVRNQSHLVLSGTHKEKIRKVLRNSLNCRFAACATSACTEESHGFHQGGVVPMENWRFRQWNEAFVGTAGILISDQFEMDFTNKTWSKSSTFTLACTHIPKGGPHLGYLQSVWRGSASHSFLEQSTSNPQLSETFWCLEFQFENSKVFQPESKKREFSPRWNQNFEEKD